MTFIRPSRRSVLGAAGAAAAIEPALATGIERIDGRTVRVTLRDDVLFRNGAKMTAEDVAFSFGEGRMFGEKPLTPRARAFAPKLARATALDARTVEFVTLKPD